MHLSYADVAVPFSHIFLHKLFLLSQMICSSIYILRNNSKHHLGRLQDDIYMKTCDSI